MSEEYISPQGLSPGVPIFELTLPEENQPLDMNDPTMFEDGREQATVKRLTLFSSRFHKLISRL